MDTSNPSAILDVKISIDNFFSITVTTNIYRKNLWQGHEGRHGFELKLTDVPSDIYKKDIRFIKAELPDRNFECLNSPMRVNKQKIAYSVCELIRTDIGKLVF